jgi:hypothetical protein
MSMIHRGRALSLEPDLRDFWNPVCTLCLYSLGRRWFFVIPCRQGLECSGGESVIVEHDKLEVKRNGSWFPQEKGRNRND